MDLDSTQELLDSTVPSSVDLDSSEDEIFFGNESNKEKQKKVKRRETLVMAVAVVEPSGGGRKTSREKMLDNEPRHSGRKSLYLQENSITEEDEEVGEVISTMEEMMLSCEIEVGCNSDSTPRGLNNQELSDINSNDIDHNNEWSEMSSGVGIISNISGINQLDSCSGIYDSFSDDTSHEIMTEEESVISGETEETNSVGRGEGSFLLDSDKSQLGSVETGFTKVNWTNTLDDDSVFKRNDNDPDEYPNIIISRPSVGITDQSQLSGVYKTAPSSPVVYPTEQLDINADDQIDFDTSAEEVLLYEMFGEDYDEVVESMTVQEKKELKEILEEKGDDEIVNIRSRLMNQLGERRASILLSAVSPFSLNSMSTLTPRRSTRTRSSYVEDDLDHPPVTANSHVPYRNQEDEQDPSVIEDQFHSFQNPDSSPTGGNKENFTIPTSPVNMMTRSKVPWMPPTPRPNEIEYHHRQTVSVSPRKPLSRVVSTSRIPQFATPVSRVPKTVNTPTPKSSRVLRNHPMCVASPVAQYVKNNPVPRLVQNVVAKECSKDLESTLIEVENIPNLQDSCPLPFAVYNPTERREQTTVNLTGKEYSYIPEAYGEVTTSTLVTRHLGRRRLEKLRDEEDNSFSYRSPGQDDGIVGESLMEMSVVETKIVKKVGMKTPRRM